jgi:predicted phage tail protein
MTTIRLHGILAQKYGKVFEMEIDKPRDVIRAIDANREGFRKTVVDLQKQGFAYELIVNKKRLNKEEFSNNKKPQEIDFVPFIVGSGPEVWISLAISLISAVLQYALMDPGTIDGGESTVSGGGSLMFSSSQVNLAAQGSPLPIGYGRLKVGSSIIQSSMKSLPQTISSIDNMYKDAFAGSEDSGYEISDPRTTV